MYIDVNFQDGGKIYQIEIKTISECSAAFVFFHVLHKASQTKKREENESNTEVAILGLVIEILEDRGVIVSDEELVQFGVEIIEKLEEKKALPFTSWLMAELHRLIYPRHA
jgi:hypothetical protein